MRGVEGREGGVSSLALSRSPEWWSTDLSQWLCALRACLRTPSVDAYRFEHPGNPQRYRALGGGAAYFDCLGISSASRGMR